MYSVIYLNFNIFPKNFFCIDVLECNVHFILLKRCSCYIFNKYISEIMAFVNVVYWREESKTVESGKAKINTSVARNTLEFP